MRVDERNLSEPASSTASRTAESQRIQVTTSGSSGTSGAAAGDHVDLSSLTGRISHTMQTLASQTSQRVSQLQKDFRTGRYQPDPQQLSRSIAAEWHGAARA